jgi:hypothetical protein
MYKMVKIEFQFFFVEMNMNKENHVKRFLRFFYGTFILLFKFSQISSRPSLEPRELRSVEISDYLLWSQGNKLNYIIF